MALSYTKRTILAKTEATYGVDPTFAAANAKLPRGLEIMPLEGEYSGRELVDGNLGIQPEELVNVHAAVKLMHEAGGGGAAGTAPAWAEFMLACGFAETINAGTSAVYDLVSDTYSSVGLRTHIGGANGHKQDVLGCRGIWSFSGSAKELPSFEYELRGQFATPVKEAAPTTDYAAHRKSPRAEPDQVTAFTIGGDTLCYSTFTIASGNQISVNRYANCAETSLGDRAITGRVVVQMPALDAKDLIAEAKAGTLQALAWSIGQSAGNILTLAAPKVQLKFAGYEESQGDLDVALDLNFTPDAGDDELTWTVT